MAVPAGIMSAVWQDTVADCGKAVRHDRPLVAGFLAGHGDHYCHGHLVALDAAYRIRADLGRSGAVSGTAMYSSLDYWGTPVGSAHAHDALALLAVLREDYVRTARAKGLHERSIILKHALQNA